MGIPRVPMVRLTLVLPGAVDCSSAVTNNSPVWRPQGHHTGLLLVTANEQSAAQGSTWGLTLTPGIDCLNHHIVRLLGRLGRYGGLYENHTFKCKIRNFLNRHFESFASYATASSFKRVLGFNRLHQLHAIAKNSHMQKYLRHCTIFWLKWPVNDLVLVIPSPPLSKLLAIQGHAQNLEEQLWMEGRREVSVYPHTCD